MPMPQFLANHNLSCHVCLSLALQDVKRGNVLTGECEPVAFRPVDADGPNTSGGLPSHYEGHRRPVVNVLYAEEFNQVCGLRAAPVLTKKTIVLGADEMPL